MSFSPSPSLSPPSARKRPLPFSLRIQTSPGAAPSPFGLGGMSSPAVSLPAQGIAAMLANDAPPSSAIDGTSHAALLPPSFPALAPLPLPPHLRILANINSQCSPASSTVPSLVESPSTTPSTATSLSSLPSLDPSRTRPSGIVTRNAKRLSISTKPSWPSLQLNAAVPHTAAERKRSNSVSVVLPYYSTTYQEEEEHDPPYPNGPVEILPRIWLGHEGHARDVKLLRERGIGWVLNVAKEVDLELGKEWQVLRLEDLPRPPEDGMEVDQEGGEKLRYLKLPWSHGQQDLCEVGFGRAMRFIDHALQGGESVLVHCQCGVSRSATLVMALVIRAGHQARICGDPEHPLRRIASHNDAYEFVQGKSRWVGPNIVLINQLVEYSKNLRTIAEAEDPAGRSRTTSECTDASQLAHQPSPPFSSSDSSASSSPGLHSPPTPDGCVSPELGPDSIEAMLLDRKMEAQYSKLCQQRAAAALLTHPHVEVVDSSVTGLKLPVPVPSPMTACLSPVSPMSTTSDRRSRTRSASAESALAPKSPWNIGMLLRVEEES
ncbi:hypothetical protein DACRYDRAFT_22352 [Dacryopinax primogenitus]|uniref:protein-tyrosine-phosphatase n=1 Tax=Dacryopinax primogenitus (strain DJM 731) TaxID=1858805 RepID=M5GCQ2_DACPD|nr:uncharacterized protein DACRYDRAFT_22352 [Dacryopinax primogenitus]EJU01908.1 hypothetical protein DACRYDRAFT_22352 [Dacryopinax primogenitus]